MPDLGDGLSDAVALREKALADEQERINMMHDDMGIPRCLEEMPDRATMDGVTIGMLFEDHETDENGTVIGKFREWYHGEIVGTTRDENGDYVAHIDWGDDTDSTDEILEADKWSGPNAMLSIGSWMTMDVNSED